jgi:hypothetical protein
MATHHLLLPYLPIKSLPKSERVAATLLQNALWNIETYVEDLHSARMLFDHSTTISKDSATKNAMSDSEANAVRKWPILACRDGAITIFNFAMCLESIKSTRFQTPSLKFDKEKIKAAGKTFREHFPDFDKIRHGVAHSAELMKNLEHFDRNATTMPVKLGQWSIPRGTLIQNAIIGRRFALTYNGKVLSYELSELSVLNLAKVRSKLFDAFPYSELEGYGPYPAPPQPQGD